ncbi:MAG: hypothetical protein R3297_08640, partial [Desulfobulbales bacterium]|nr:hypothetical protein [Desulfobulbales bacterium]
MKKLSILSIFLFAIAAFAVWAPSVDAYPEYQTANGAGDSCSQCHPGFDGGFAGPLHSIHLNYTNGCNSCHNAGGGSIPVLIGSSDGGAQPGCTGCHQADGLQEHHTNAGAPPDGNGLACATCHPNRSPVPENVPPPYYGTSVSAIDDPCSSQPPPGEDGDLQGDGGLDNDGDLIYDEADPDCAEPECLEDADCDDLLFCTGVETCVDGVCVAGTPVDCNDGVDCTEDTCDEDADACVHTPNDGFCDDSDVCNGQETCDPVNGCQSGTPLDCDDGDLCTIDGCGPLVGCVYDPVVCPAGQACDPADGICKPSAECTVDEDCDDLLYCTGVETCVDG